MLARVMDCIPSIPTETCATCLQARPGSSKSATGRVAWVIRRARIGWPGGRYIRACSLAPNSSARKQKSLKPFIPHTSTNPPCNYLYFQHSHETRGRGYPITVNQNTPSPARNAPTLLPPATCTLFRRTCQFAPRVFNHLRTLWRCWFLLCLAPSIARALFVKKTGGTRGYMFIRHNVPFWNANRPP